MCSIWPEEAEVLVIYSGVLMDREGSLSRQNRTLLVDLCVYLWYWIE